MLYSWNWNPPKPSVVDCLKAEVEQLRNREKTLRQANLQKIDEKDK